jgi:hypothetical protein
MMRWRVLVSPVFTGAVAVLAVNDHLLKHQWPGFVTGKLSDIAGLAVIVILLTILVRPAPAVALTAAGFIALKAVPDVNVLAAPLLGGVTIADRSDLIALLILWPVYRWLTVAQRDERRDRPEASPARHLLAVPALCVAVLACTATSCGGPLGVNVIAVDDDLLYAGLTTWELDLNTYAGTWAVSTDGGYEWHEADQEPATDAISSGEEFCTDSECWRVVLNDRLRRCDPDSECITVTSATDHQLPDVGRCTWGNGWFNSVIVVPGVNEPVVMVAMGSGGILVQTDEGWESRAVLDAPPTVASTAGRTISVIAPFALLILGPLLLRWTPLHRSRHRTQQATAIVLLGGAMLFVLLVAALVFGGPSGWTIAILSVMVFGLSVGVALAPDHRLDSIAGNQSIDR